MFPLIGTTTTMRGVFERMRRAAQVDSPVVIWGEKGAGKRLAAEMIHLQSRRASGPLVTISTEEMSSVMVERELFGDFPESVAALRGEDRGPCDPVFGGTLLIEEITALASTAQARLLRVMEDRGGSAGVWRDGAFSEFRLMATTRYDPVQSLDRGAMREDLYYRLAVVPIRMPSLSERREDIPWLVRQILAEWCGSRGRPVPQVEPELMERLVERPWPGNIDELRECLINLVATHDTGTLEVRHLPRWFVDEEDGSNGARPRRIDATLAELERKAVTVALGTHQGNRTRAAKALGISVRTLQRKLKQWEM
jgi:DNA-binding NtrC family response regulator